MMIRYYKAVMQPPYRGVVATMVGMTWARAAIFYGSDVGKEMMMDAGFNATVSQTMPPLIIGTLVQIINMPLVRATITIQDPSSTMNSTTEAMVHIYRTRGIAGLWHGVSAGIMKTVPKYVTAVAVKDYMEDHMPRAEPGDKQANMLRSAVKSVSAGLAGAILTNPLDVLRNEYVLCHILVLVWCGSLIRTLLSARRASCCCRIYTIRDLHETTTFILFVGMTTCYTHMQYGCALLILCACCLLRRMFKTDLGLKDSFSKLVKEEGASFMLRGMTANMTAVAFPLATTIFMTDMLMSTKKLVN
jgi:hypothetical protein